MIFNVGYILQHHTRRCTRKKTCKIGAHGKQRELESFPKAIEIPEAEQKTFLLLAHDAGLGACIFAGTVHCPEIVHRNFAIPDTKLLAIGIALGWPDIDAPINNFEQKRGKVEEFVRWIS
ncbi:MAG: hypothetical protein ABSG91_20690 [Syntrophobacteraceae bacterium]